MNQNEEPEETIRRVKRSAERIYLDLTAQGDKRISTVKNTTTYLGERVAQLAGLVMELADTLAPSTPPQPDARALALAASQKMREEAAERFPRLYYEPRAERWIDQDTYQEVVFTPHGWRLEHEVRDSPDFNLYVQ